MIRYYTAAEIAQIYRRPVLIDGCERGHLVFDHCHEHGWVRAVLCSKHNSWLGHLEAAMREWSVDLSATPYAPILAACAGCSP